MKRYLPLLLVFGCAAALGAGIVRLLQLRFEAGDVYPPYSSLRADPLGTMAIYEGLGRLPGFQVERDFGEGSHLPEARNAVYLHLAASAREWRFIPQETFTEIERFVHDGGRLVIAFYPESSGDLSFFERIQEDHDRRAEGSRPEKDVKAREDHDAKSGTGGQTNKPADADSQKGSNRPRARDRRREWPAALEEISLADRWGIDFRVVALEKGEGGMYEPVRVTNSTALPLPAALSWHSGIVLSNTPAWRPIYFRGTNAVVVERRFGRGTVVWSTDSYFLSNEAMQRDRHPEVLAWLIGPGNRIVFDEAHLGVVEHTGIAGLVRKYRLGGVAFGLLLIAVLFIWKNTMTLVPRRLEGPAGVDIEGKDAARGLVNLLRRAIRPRDLLGVCFAEWKKTSASTAASSAERLRQAEAVLQAETAAPPGQRDPVRAYRVICHILKTRSAPPPDPAVPQPPSTP